MVQAPGRSDRDGITIIELMQMFPTDDAARKWLEAHVWPDGRHCPHCGSENTTENKGKSESRPYHCRDCSQHFSVRIGTIMEGSRLSFQKWVFAIYLHMTSLKGVSSMKLHRDLGITQKTAWFMLQRIREAFKRDDDEPPLGGPVEVDESFIGGLRKNKSNAKRKEAEGRGAVDMTAVVGAKDRGSNEVRADVIQNTDAATLVAFVMENAAQGSLLQNPLKTRFFA